MAWMRELGQSGLRVSALGLGTVKLGRDQGVRYPRGFTIPDDRAARALLDRARDLGINLIDTAPAYGSSEQRLGQLLAGQRGDWVICSKVGEEFEDGQSRFDFSPEHTCFSVDRSLLRLNTEMIDIVLVHSDGNDLAIIEQLGTLQALAELKKDGKIRAFGISTKTVEGGLAAVPHSDVLMLTYNLNQMQDRPVLDACAANRKGVLIKKAFASGHLAQTETDPVQASMDLVFSHPATSSVVVGTINPVHLEANATAARRSLRV